MSPRTPVTKAARHAKIRELITRGSVRSQADLVADLAEEGVAVTQGTLSRDLVELGAARVRAGDGGMVYAVPGEGHDGTLHAERSAAETTARLRSLCRDLLLSAEASANLVILRTPPGAAQFLASAVDNSGMDEVLGAIAGDDTIMVVTRDPAGGAAVASRFGALAEGRG